LPPESFEALLAQISAAYNQVHSEREAFHAELQSLRKGGGGAAKGSWQNDHASSSVVSLPWVLRADPVVKSLEAPKGDKWDPMDEHMVHYDQVGVLNTKASPPMPMPKLPGGEKPRSAGNSYRSIGSHRTSSVAKRASAISVFGPDDAHIMGGARHPKAVDLEDIRQQFIRLDGRNHGRLCLADCLGVAQSLHPDINTEVFTRAMSKLVAFLSAARSTSWDRTETLEQTASDTQQDQVKTADSDTNVSHSHSEQGQKNYFDLEFDTFCLIIFEENPGEVLEEEEVDEIFHFRAALYAEAEAHAIEREGHAEDVQGNVLDTISAAVIFLNAFLIGVSADQDENATGWIVSEVLFAIFFLSELLIKMRRYGCYMFFFGKNWLWNGFDLLVVAVALFDLGVTFVVVSGGKQVGGLDGVTFISMVRLFRLARLVRLLRFKVFHELKMMIQGVFAGLRVLFWAVVLLVFFIYILALVLLKFMSTDDFIYTRERSFESLPWAMFTLFRCFTDGCSAFDGTPLHLHLFDRYGAKFMISYILVFLFVTIGIFNLIMAIFIDNVMEASIQRKQKERGANATYMESKLKELIMDLAQRESPKKKQSRGRVFVAFVTRLLTKVRDFFLSSSAKEMNLRKRSASADANIKKLEVQDLTITRDLFKMWLQDPDLLEMLDDMDIGTANKTELFDVLDCDLSGELEVPEVVSGLMKLRGPSEKSDTVAALLGVRYITTLVEDVHAKICGEDEFDESRQSRRSFVLAS